MIDSVALTTTAAPRVLASIPSPPWSEWQLGPFTLRAYAICIIVGVIAAVAIGNRRWVARGGETGVVVDLVLWAVPFGIVGARLYHVITDYQLYFGPGRNPIEALAIWNGGLGIWGAIAGGGLGVWITCRRRGIPMPAMADALAPALAVAQAIGRLGNWFNQELFGGPSTLPWALEIDPINRIEGYEQYATYHPTFLYELLWCLGVAVVVIWADRRFRLGHGRAFALYVAAYTLGRVWIEMMRTDTVNHVLGLRLNVWTSVLVFAGAVVYLVISGRKRPGREEPALLGPSDAADPDHPEESEDSADSGEPADSDESPDSGESARAVKSEDSEDEPRGEKKDADPPDTRSSDNGSEATDSQASEGASRSVH